MDSRPPRLSTEENICQQKNKLELEPEENMRGEEVENDIATSPELLPPAIIVSSEASPSMVRSAEKRPMPFSFTRISSSEKFGEDCYVRIGIARRFR